MRLAVSPVTSNNLWPSTITIWNVVVISILFNVCARFACLCFPCVISCRANSVRCLYVRDIQWFFFNMVYTLWFETFCLIMLSIDSKSLFNCGWFLFAWPVYQVSWFPETIRLVDSPVSFASAPTTSQPLAGCFIF